MNLRKWEPFYLVLILARDFPSPVARVVGRLFHAAPCGSFLSRD